MENPALLNIFGKKYSCSYEPTFLKRVADIVTKNLSANLAPVEYDVNFYFPDDSDGLVNVGIFLYGETQDLSAQYTITPFLCDQRDVERGYRSKFLLDIASDPQAAVAKIEKNFREGPNFEMFFVGLHGSGPLFTLCSGKDLVGEHIDLRAQFHGPLVFNRHPEKKIQDAILQVSEAVKYPASKANLELYSEESEKGIAGLVEKVLLSVDVGKSKGFRV